MQSPRTFLGVQPLEAREVPASLSVGDVRISEGDSGTKIATVTVSLSAADSRPVSVRYATGDGTARAGQDYNAASGTLTFSPGQRTGTIGVGVLGDTLAERDESFVINLSGAVNAVIGRNTGRVTVANDDPRTFVFFFGGFASSGANSGLETLRQRLVGDPTISRNAILSQVSHYNTDSAAARAAVRQTLDAQLATPLDRVVLVGHSYGGNMAYLLANDVDGRGRAATALATLDPIDWVQVWGGVGNQSADRFAKPSPASLPRSNVLNLVQRAGSLQGFRITPLDGVVNDNVTAGPDGRLGTGDDLGHTTIDDSGWVQGRLHSFVRRFVSG